MKSTCARAEVERASKTSSCPAILLIRKVENSKSLLLRAIYGQYYMDIANGYIATYIWLYSRITPPAPRLLEYIYLGVYVRMLLQVHVHVSC